MSQSILVAGQKFPVVERAGYLKAHLFGHSGWTSVWGQDTEELRNRIRSIFREEIADIEFAVAVDKLTKRYGGDR